jgi:hypothetical protein
MKNVDSKKCQSSVKIKNKKSSNEKIINEVHWIFLIYVIFISKFLNDMIIVKFYHCKSISHFKN